MQNKHLPFQVISVINYEICTITGDVRNAGTNAKVFLQVYGELGKTEVLILKNRSNNHERGASEKFKTSGVGKKKKKKKKIPTEEKEEEETHQTDALQVYNFVAHRWLASDEEDKELVVELTPEEASELEANTYEVHVITGVIWGAGTDANVYLSIYGERGDTGERHLKYSNHLNKFEKKQVDVFTVKAIDLGELKKLRIRHDDSGSNSAWFLERIDIIDTKEESM
ncbi:lipoxygenase domain-containing protein 1 [Crotalus adamanteus]|uniref:Lipoxygenase domain-containing protein 1 n=1 Tax=Crotalus adamanteus TaxID=8729 RepID=A0AAW1C359_CROAD